MPTLKVLDKLKSQVNHLGDEPRIRESRGEMIPDIRPLEDAKSQGTQKNQPIEEQDDSGGVNEMEALLDSYSDEMEKLEQSDADDWPEVSGEEPPDSDLVSGSDIEPEPEEEDLPTGNEPDSAMDISDKDIESVEDEFPPPEDDILPPTVDTPSPEEGDVEAFHPGDMGELVSDTMEEVGAEDDIATIPENASDKDLESPPSSEDSEQFSLDGFGDEYKFSYDDTKLGDDIDITDIEQLSDDFEESPMEKSSFQIEEEDFNALQDALRSCPRNLKVALETLLADSRRSEESLQELIKAILKGSGPRTMAKLYQSITKRRIELPRNYKKLSGKAFENLQNQLLYRAFRQALPIIRTALSIILVIWILGIVSFMWIYRPLKAESLYRKGLEYITEDEVDKAVESFNDAWHGWPIYSKPDGEKAISTAPLVVKGWKDNNRWLVYAREFRQRKYFKTASVFYRGYLTEKPKSMEGRIEYGMFLARILGDYETAIMVIEALPEHKDMLLASGDIYLEWAQEDVTKYEDARLRYAKALENARDNERAILSMMRYHLLTQNDEEIETLLPILHDEAPGKTSAPELAANVYANLAEFHLSRDNKKEAMRFIELAEAASPESPYPFFIEAHYWKSNGNEQKEFENYQRTLINLKNKEFMTREDMRMRILSLGGIGRYYANIANRLPSQTHATVQNHSQAISSYGMAVNLYRDAISRNQLKGSSEYGKLFIEIGDIIYQGRGYAGETQFSLTPTREVLDNEEGAELRQVEYYYNQAEKLLNRGNGGSQLPDRALYRRAYIRYLLGMDDALIDFHRISRRRPNDYDSHLALATMLLSNGDYEASRTQYSRSIELMEEALSDTGGILDIDKRQAHADILIRYVAAWNNLGVSYALSAARGGRDKNYAAALSAFTMASDYLDQVYSDMQTLTSRGATGLRDQEDRRIVEKTGNLNFLKEKVTFPYQNRLRLLGEENAGEGEPGYLIYPSILSDLSS